MVEVWFVIRMLYFYKLWKIIDLRILNIFGVLDDVTYHENLIDKYRERIDQSLNSDLVVKYDNKDYYI